MFMRKENKNRTGGFTLVELLVVIAIIGLLASMIAVSLTSFKTKSRDSRRMSDMISINQALQMYFHDFTLYPVYDGFITGSDTMSAALKSANYISSVPSDPVNAVIEGVEYKYYYFSADGSDFKISYCLETDSIPDHPKGCSSTINIIEP